MNDQDRDDAAAVISTVLNGRYRILSLLGSGGMADVYLAEDETLGRLVAVKILKDALAADAEFVERFRIEAQAAARLNHPNIVAVYDRGSVEGSTYIAMEYVCGESLKQRIRRDGALAPDEAVEIALAALSALEAAHEQDIVHRDVTAHNVLLDERSRVKVADFGIARVGASALTRTGAMLGTSSYLSPEQAQGQSADERSDLYTLGVVLFEMLTGRVPFRGETDVAVVLQHVSAAPPNPRSIAPGVSEPLAAVVMQALSKHPDDRHQTAAEFAAALRRARREGHDPPSVPWGAAATSVDGSRRGTDGRTRLAADAPTRYVARGPAPPPQARPVRSRWRVRRRTALIVLLALVIAAAAAAIYFFVIAAGPTVPDVIGKERGAATKAVRGQGLTPVLHYVWSDRQATDAVVRQAPRSGTKVEKGVKVDLWVSRGPLHIPAPDLEGLATDVADQRLKDVSLNGRGRRAASETAPKGEIFKQKPAAGATVERGDTVTYWVSSGPPKIDVPDVVGLSQGDAAAVLEDAGFTVNTDLVIGFGEFPGDVVAQDPIAGTRARTGDEIIIEVAVF